MGMDLEVELLCGFPLRHEEYPDEHVSSDGYEELHILADKICDDKVKLATSSYGEWSTFYVICDRVESRQDYIIIEDLPIVTKETKQEMKLFCQNNNFVYEEPKWMAVASYW